MRCNSKSISELCCKCQTEERVVVHFILENNRRSAAAGISGPTSYGAGIIIVPDKPTEYYGCPEEYIYPNTPVSMCGIFFSLSTAGPVLPTEETSDLLRQRGPDSFRVHNVHRDIQIHDSKDDGQILKTVPAHLTFISTVLSLRGDHVHAQPLVDKESQSVLCWNGEAWKAAGEPVQDNDTELIFQLFLQAAKPSSASGDAVQRLADLISSISGPFSFVFYDAFSSKLFFSRDCLGRRSLLHGTDENGSLKLCSLCDGTSSTVFEEVDTNGVHMIDLTVPGTATAYNIQTLPWSNDKDLQANHLVRDGPNTGGK